MRFKNQNNHASSRSIVAIGSANMDYCVPIQRLPMRGETLLGGDMQVFFGGKGANQAVAAARLDGDVALIAKVGDDAAAGQYIDHLQSENVDASHLFRAAGCATGAALILVEDLGQNMIVVSPSANMKFDLTDLEQAEQAIAEADILLLQMEIPLEVIEASIRLANQHQVKVILNPSPVNARFRFDGLRIDYLVVNVIEAEMLTGIACRNLDTLCQAAEALTAMGAINVVIKRGQESTLVDFEDNIVFVPTIHVEPVDTVGAGDAFTGALAVALSENMDMVSAVRFANCAGALSTTRYGAQSAMPLRKSVEECLTTDLDMVNDSSGARTSLFPIPHEI